MQDVSDDSDPLESNHSWSSGSDILRSECSSSNEDEFTPTGNELIDNMFNLSFNDFKTFLCDKDLTKLQLNQLIRDALTNYGATFWWDYKHSIRVVDYLLELGADPHLEINLEVDGFFDMSNSLLKKMPLLSFCLAISRFKLARVVLKHLEKTPILYKYEVNDPLYLMLTYGMKQYQNARPFSEHLEDSDIDYNWHCHKTYHINCKCEYRGSLPPETQVIEFVEDLCSRGLIYTGNILKNGDETHSTVIRGRCRSNPCNYSKSFIENAASYIFTLITSEYFRHSLDIARIICQYGYIYSVVTSNVPPMEYASDLFLLVSCGYKYKTIIEDAINGKFGPLLSIHDTDLNGATPLLYYFRTIKEERFHNDDYGRPSMHDCTCHINCKLVGRKFFETPIQFYSTTDISMNHIDGNYFDRQLFYESVQMITFLTNTLNAQTNIIDNSGRNAFHYLCEGGVDNIFRKVEVRQLRKVIRILSLGGCDFNLTDQQNITPLAMVYSEYTLIGLHPRLYFWLLILYLQEGMDINKKSIYQFHTRENAPNDDRINLAEFRPQPYLSHQDLLDQIYSSFDFSQPIRFVDMAIKHGHIELVYLALYTSWYTDKREAEDYRKISLMIDALKDEMENYKLQLKEQVEMGSMHIVEDIPSDGSDEENGYAWIQIPEIPAEERDLMYYHRKYVGCVTQIRGRSDYMLIKYIYLIDQLLSQPPSLSHLSRMSIRSSIIRSGSNFRTRVESLHTRLPKLLRDGLFLPMLNNLYCCGVATATNRDGTIDVCCRYCRDDPFTQRFYTYDEFDYKHTRGDKWVCPANCDCEMFDE